MNRPKIKIELDLIDKIIEGIGILGILLLIGLPIIYYGDLPDTIPRHFGLNGEPDGFSGKGIIWTLPILGSIMYIGMVILNKHPHIFNYPKKITEENAERLYRITTKLIRFLNTAIVCIFSYMTYATIRTALGKQGGMGNYFILVFLILIIGILGYFLIKMINKSQTANKKT